MSGPRPTSRISRGSSPCVTAGPGELTPAVPRDDDGRARPDGPPRAATGARADPGDATMTADPPPDVDAAKASVPAEGRAIGWVDEHGDALFRFALARLGSRELAEDLVQETFLAALTSLDRFEG